MKKMLFLSIGLTLALGSITPTYTFPKITQKQQAMLYKIGDYGKGMTTAAISVTALAVNYCILKELTQLTNKAQFKKEHALGAFIVGSLGYVSAKAAEKSYVCFKSAHKI